MRYWARPAQLSGESMAGMEMRPSQHVAINGLAKRWLSRRPLNSQAARSDGIRNDFSKVSLWNSTRKGLRFRVESGTPSRDGGNEDRIILPARTQRRETSYARNHERSAL